MSEWTVSGTPSLSLESTLPSPLESTLSRLRSSVKVVRPLTSLVGNVPSGQVPPEIVPSEVV